MELRLRTLTPLHVGDGTTLHTLDYVTHGGRFYRTSRRFFERFLEYMKDDKSVDLYDRFVEWANDLNERMNDVENERHRNPRNRDHNQTLSDLRRQFSMHEFAKKAGQEKPFIEYLQQQKTPSLPIFSEDKRIVEIRGFLRDADERVYLPGSSIKGCIRTALLFHFLETRAKHPDIQKILADSLRKVQDERIEAEKKRQRFNPERHKKNFAVQLEYAAFIAGMTDNWGKQRDGEAQDDLMKCLLVSDVEVPPTGVGIEKIDLYLVKKLPKGGGYESQRQRQAPAVEAIQPGQTLTARLDFNIELLLLLHQKDCTGNGLKIGREHHFIGWRDKVETIFGLTEADLDSVPPKAPNNDATLAKLREKALAHILACCKRFTDAQEMALARWQKDDFCNPKHNPGAMARDFENGAANVYEARRTRLHFGFATGFEGITVVLHLLEHHRKVFAEIMEVFGIGDSPSAWKNRRPGEGYKPTLDKFPKSRRLATRPGEIIPMGWLEWVDDPNPRAATVKSSIKSNIQNQLETSGPNYPKGPIRQGLEVKAEIISCGVPNKVKLRLGEDNQPIIDLRYGLGFSPDKVGQVIIVKISGVRGKGEVVSIQFVKFT